MSVTLVNGVATFAGLSYNKAETIDLSFTSNGSGISAATSGNIVVSPSTPDHLLFGQQPTTTTATAALNPAVTVDIVDQFGNLTNSSAQVSVSAVGPGGFSAGSTTSVPAVAGVATFNNLHLNTDGAYTISATSTVTGASFQLLQRNRPDRDFLHADDHWIRGHLQHALQ